VTRLSRWLPLIIAAASVLVRLPFLVQGEAFFNSDEALEGLMARHIRELPIFFWGQGYKGVPEVYLSATAFAIFGAGVVQLKAVTMAIWCGAVAVSTRLGQRWYGDIGGTVTGAMLVLGPPSVVYWSLSGSAEVAWLTLIFSGVLLAYQRSVDDPGRPVSPIVMIGSGAALWVHPIAAAFIGGLAITAALRSRRWRERGWAGLGHLILGRHVSGVTRVLIVTLHVIVACEIVAFVWTYLGFRVNVGVATAAHPQKVFRMLAIAMALTVVVHAFVGDVVARGRALRALGWFAIGLLPVFFYIARGGAPGSIISVHAITDAPALFKVFLLEAAPMMLGVRAADVGPLVSWWTTVPFLVLLATHAMATSPEWFRLTRSAHRPADVLAVYVACCLFLLLGPGGAFNDIHSYRYVMPYYGLMALSAASTIRFMAGRSRLSAACFLIACLGAFAYMNVRWYATFHVDDSDREIAACLEARGIRAATADYWIAYRMTFLADERVIVNPDVSPRYQPYTEAVAAAPRRAWIQFTDGRATERRPGQAICAAATLEAVAVQ
jgi:hypothetical protein